MQFQLRVALVVQCVVKRWRLWLCVLSLSPCRLHTAQRAIKQTQVTVQRIGKEIEEKLRTTATCTVRVSTGALRRQFPAHQQLLIICVEAARGLFVRNSRRYLISSRQTADTKSLSGFVFWENVHGLYDFSDMFSENTNWHHGAVIAVISKSRSASFSSNNKHPFDSNQHWDFIT